MDREPVMGRTMTLSAQLSEPDLAIRDFLKIPHDDGDEEQRPSTLMDTIAADVAGGIGGMISYWRPLRDRLRLSRAAELWSSPSPEPPAASTAGTLSSSNSLSNKYNYSPGEAAAAFARTFSRGPSLRATPTVSRLASTTARSTSTSSSRRRSGLEDEEEELDDDEEEEEEEESKNQSPSAQMSLMSLLEQTGNQWDEEEEGAGAAPKKDEGKEEEMVHVCCVCMVRHKGAAFIPCGHTFCRLCSRELWVSRGNCPLCNGFIQEILDIF